LKSYRTIENIFEAVPFAERMVQKYVPVANEEVERITEPSALNSAGISATVCPSASLIVTETA
jgi:hypothetical protein